MDKRFLSMMKRRKLGKILRLPYASANLINEPPRGVPIRVRAELTYRDGRSEQVYVIGFDHEKRRLIFSSEKDKHNFASTSNVDAMLVGDIVRYRSLKPV